MKTSLFILIAIAMVVYAKEMPSSYTLNFERGNNPYNIHYDSKRSNNYFIVMGDWGQHEGGNYDCQKKVAESMKKYVANQKAAGKTLLFIAAVGDNFYWQGMDYNQGGKGGKWQSVWEDIYGDLTQDYYWFPCMGNHDYGPVDGFAMCPWAMDLDRAGNQLPDCAPPKYKMQDYGYYYRFDELSFEFLSLDTNVGDCPNGIGGDGRDSYFANCGGKYNACKMLGYYRDAGAELLKERNRESTAESFYAIQHYDGVCQNWVFPNLGTPKNAKDIKCAHGHTHQQKCMWGSDPDCKVIMSGAAGGCCGESHPYGFSSVELTDDGKMKTTTNVEPIWSCGWSQEEF